MFGFHCIIVIPFFISGIYLYVLANHQDALVIDSEQSKEFFDVLNTTILIKTHIKEKVLTIQNHFCCCGYFNSSDWQNAAGRQNGASLSVMHENDTLTCPIPAESQCREKFYEGCVTKIPRIGCTFILVSSLIGLFCGFVALITSPCFYGSFEYDRRLARAKYIRQWRFQLDRELEEQRNFENDNMQPAVRRETQEALELLTSTTQQSLDDSKLDGKLMDDIKLSHKDATHGQNLLYVSQSRDASNSETDAHRRDHKGRASSSQSLITNQSLEQHHGESKHSQDE
ncbi:hypothetical protein DICVIV_01494 [Dictyocaulus viviparus]|uniref:Tetraspanin family protein n=1 Tax=Dictyocaulus viviparus TaxID=29172 RepID=A0A0D8Y7X9_DICVI|nr:hypothetical protein DICVIV_01494 [Dictyocaulus viviparus]